MFTDRSRHANVPSRADHHRRADDVHLMALSNLDGEYARIVDTAGVLAGLTASGSGAAH